MQQVFIDKWQQFAKPERLNRWAVRALSIVAVWLLAQLVWVWVDAFTSDYKVAATPRPKANSRTASQTNVSVSGVVDKHLFGDATAVPVEAPPEPQVVAEQIDVTRLNLKLRGVYASDINERGSAIIELASGKQEVFFVGEAITGARNTKLHQVQPIKVILNNSGKFEALELEQKLAEVTSTGISLEAQMADGLANQTVSRKSVIDNPRVKKELSDIRSKLQSDPTSLKDMMRWEPVMKDGQLQGVRISPGKSRRLFYDLKLRRNDIVTSINGTSLSDPSQLLSLQQQMVDAQEVSLSIMRNGVPQDITIKLGEN